MPKPKTSEARIIYPAVTAKAKILPHQWSVNADQHKAATRENHTMPQQCAGGFEAERIPQTGYRTGCVSQPRVRKIIGVEFNQNLTAVFGSKLI